MASVDVEVVVLAKREPFQYLMQMGLPPLTR